MRITDSAFPAHRCFGGDCAREGALALVDEFGSEMRMPRAMAVNTGGDNLNRRDASQGVRREFDQARP
jgi:hypothetical protein